MRSKQHLFAILGTAFLSSASFADIASETAKRDELRNRQDAMNANISTLQTQQKDLSAEQEGVNEQIAKTKSEEQTLRSELAKKNAELSAHQQGLSALTPVVQQAQAEQQQAEAAVKSRQSERDSAASALEAAKMDRANADGATSSLRQREQSDKIALSDLSAKLSQSQAQLVQVKATSVHAPAAAQRLMKQVGVVQNASRHCSAITVKNAVIRTALHCVSDLGSVPAANLEFVSGLGEHLKVTAILATDEGHDEVLLKLASESGSDSNPVAAPNLTQPVRLLARDSSTGVLSFSSECRILSLNLLEGTFIHDCSSAPGSSGGALVQNGMVVGSHLGRLGDHKLATYIYTQGRRAIDPKASQQMIPEYNCNSDCRAASYRSVRYPCPNWKNPRKMCDGDQVFDPTLFSICETARTADCSAQVAKAAEERALASVQVEVANLADSVSYLDVLVSQEASKVANLQGTLSSSRSTLGQAQNSVTDLRNQLASVADHIVATVAQQADLSKAVDAARHAVIVDASQTTALAAETANIVAENDVAKKAAAEVTITIRNLETSVAKGSEDLSKLTVELGDIARDIATNQTIVRTADLVKNAAVQVGVASKKNLQESNEALKIGVSKAIDSVGDPHPLAASIGGLGGQLMQKLGAASQLYFQKTKSFLNKQGSSLASAWHGLIGLGSKESNGINILGDFYNSLLVQEVCIDRAMVRITAYRKTIAALGLSDWPAHTERQTLDHIVVAKNILDNQVHQLAAITTEIVTNNCDKIGIEGPLAEALTDAQEWQAWVRGLFLQQIEHAQSAT